MIWKCLFTVWKQEQLQNIKNTLFDANPDFRTVLNINIPEFRTVLKTNIPELLFPESNETFSNQITDAGAVFVIKTVLKNLDSILEWLPGPRKHFVFASVFPRPRWPPLGFDSARIPDCLKYKYVPHINSYSSNSKQSCTWSPLTHLLSEA